jgi:crotonobetainyl-CoA:carnitine CoA-transferase CaiB-like acyl-CoA transferase
VLAGVKALLARERGGAGQHVEVSMLEVAAWFAFLDTAGSAILPEARARRAATTPRRGSESRFGSPTAGGCSRWVTTPASADRARCSEST